jgi:hypothetical protein
MNATDTMLQYSNGTMNLSNVYAVTLLHDSDESSITTDDQNAAKSDSIGFEVYGFEKTSEGFLRSIAMAFRSETPKQIKHWYRLLSKFVTSGRSFNWTGIDLASTRLL